MNDGAKSIYFVAGAGLIKIGLSQSPMMRVEQLRNSGPVAIELLGVIPATVWDERAIHAKFIHLRSHGEWFRADRKLVSFIAEAVARGEIPAEYRGKSGQRSPIPQRHPPMSGERRQRHSEAMRRGWQRRREQLSAEAQQ